VEIVSCAVGVSGRSGIACLEKLGTSQAARVGLVFRVQSYFEIPEDRNMDLGLGKASLGGFWSGFSKHVALVLKGKGLEHQHHAKDHEVIHTALSDHHSVTSSKKKIGGRALYIAAHCWIDLAVIFPRTSLRMKVL